MACGGARGRRPMLQEGWVGSPDFVVSAFSHTPVYFARARGSLTTARTVSVLTTVAATTAPPVGPHDTTRASRLRNATRWRGLGLLVLEPRCARRRRRCQIPEAGVVRLDDHARPTGAFEHVLHEPAPVPQHRARFGNRFHPQWRANFSTSRSALTSGRSQVRNWNSS